MHHDSYYQQVGLILSQPPRERYHNLCELHSNIVHPYLEALHAITPEGAQRKVPDGRSVMQVVGHIAEWERYIIVSSGEIVAGVKWPGLLAHVRYVLPDGTDSGFPNRDEFNARQTEQYADRLWPEVLDFAMYSATTLHRMYVQSGLIMPELLERTRLWEHYRLPGGDHLKLPCGWYLWTIILEHEGVEHIADLSVGRGT